MFMETQVEFMRSRIQDPRVRERGEFLVFLRPRCRTFPDGGLLRERELSQSMSKHDQQMEMESLAEYAASGSEDAFRRVVQAWLPLVMGTALRRTAGQRAVAEDITQSVFIDLARQAKSVRGGTLSGWLHKHTCFTASKVLRGERRRARREQIAAEDVPVSVEADPEKLDELLLDLGEGDRETLLLRYVEGRSHDEVAEALGITRSAAQKRSERALERLRSSYRSDLTGAGVALMVAPPMTGVAELTNTIAGFAVSATGSAPALSVFAKPLAGAMWGVAAAITLAAVPLAKTWRDYTAVRTGASVPVVANSEGVERSSPASRIGNTSAQRPSSIQSPEEAVTTLLAIADRYGVGKASAMRATAIIQSLPADWSHEVLMGLGRRTPVKVRGTYWFPTVGKALASNWRPRRVPDDLIAAWPMFPMNVRMKLFGGCAAVDLPATLELLEGFEREERLEDLGLHRQRYHDGFREAIFGHLLRDSPREAVAFFNTLPLWDSANSTMVGRNKLYNAGRDPAVRDVLWDALDTLDDGHRSQLKPILMRNVGREEQRAEVEAIEDPVRRARAATAIAADMDDFEEWWKSQVPESLRLQMAARLGPGTADGQERAVRLMMELENGGGGPEFDPMRRRAVRIGKYRKNLDHAALAAMADRITDPALRMVALAEILPKFGDSGEISREDWMRNHLSAEEREVLEAIWIPGDFH